MNQRIFITGIGTGVGKTVTAACITEALQADYWKPVQTGEMEGTDTATVRALLSNNLSVCHPEVYCLKEPASPHLAARLEGVEIQMEKILAAVPSRRPLVIEGAGGLLVPVTDTVLTIDLIRELQASVIIVAQNYLGSINHALLTARVLQHTGVPVIGWVFSGIYHSNEDDIVTLSGYPKIGRIAPAADVSPAFIMEQAALLRENLGDRLSS